MAEESVYLTKFRFKMKNIYEIFSIMQTLYLANCLLYKQSLDISNMGEWALASHLRHTHKKN